MIRLPYPGEPGGPPMGGAPMGGAPMGGSMPGTGYDQYMPQIRQQMMAPPMRIRMPRPVPRFPTPGRMDGMRLATGAQQKDPMMRIMPMPAMGPMV